MDANVIFYMFIVQMIMLPIQGLLFLATRREKEATHALIREAFKHSMRVIVSKRR